MGCHAGILKAVYGISASMYATVYANTYDTHGQADGLGFMLFISISSTALGLLALPFFNIVPFRQAQEHPGGFPCICMLD